MSGDRGKMRSVAWMLLLFGSCPSTFAPRLAAAQTSTPAPTGTPTNTPTRTPTRTPTTTYTPTQTEDPSDGFTFTVSPEGLTVREYTLLETFDTGSRLVAWTKSETYVDVVLDHAPSSSVTLPVSSSTATEVAVSPTALVFTPRNWNVRQRITISAVDDAFVDGSVAAVVVTDPAISDDPLYAGVDPQDFGVTVEDNDYAADHVSTVQSVVSDEGIIYDPDAAKTTMRVAYTVISPASITDIALCGPILLTGVDVTFSYPDGSRVAGQYGLSTLVISGSFATGLTLHGGTGVLETIYPGYYSPVLSQTRMRWTTATITAPSARSLGCVVAAPPQNPSLAPTRPAGTTDVYATSDGSPLRVEPTQGVLVNDTAMIGERYRRPLRAKLATAPSNGTIDLLPDGSFTYTATAPFQGVDTFTYLPVQNEIAASAPVTVTLDVTFATPTATTTPTPTDTPTDTPSATPSHSPTLTATSTSSATPSPTATATPTPSDTPTPSHTPTQTATVSPTTTPTHSPTATATQTPTTSSRHIPTQTATQTSSATATASVTPTLTSTATRTPTSTPTVTATLTASNTPTSSATQTATTTATSTPTGTPTRTATTTPTQTATEAPTATTSPTSTLTSTSTPTSTHTASNTPTGTATPTPSSIAIPTLTATGTLPPTPTTTPSPTPSPSPTATTTQSPTLTATVFPTVTPSPTRSATPSHTASATRTHTATPSATSSPTPTTTSTRTPTSTLSATPSPSSSSSPTAAATSTMTASPSASPTPSVTPTATLAVGPGLGAIDVSYIYLTTGRIGHDLDNGRLRLVAHVDDTTAAALPTRLMQESLALRVYDSTGAFDVTLPLSRCQARGRAVTCQPGLGSLARLALTPIPGAPGSWRLRVYARRLTDLATGPVGSTRNPYVAPVVVELGGQSGSIEACKPVYRTALRCRR